MNFDPALLAFDEERHEYKYQGVVVPSVSEILASTLYHGSMDAIDPWYAQRGSAFHAAVALDNAGNLDEESLDPCITGFFKAFKAFKKEHGFKPQTWEQRFYEPDGQYCGTYDAEDGQDVWDFKTGSRHWWHDIQILAYAKPLGLKTGKLVYVSEDGTYKVTPVEYRDDGIFKACCMVHREKMKHKRVKKYES